MLRRSKDLSQNGQPVLSLPPKLVTIVECQFDAAEHAFYDALAQKLGSQVDNLQRMHAMHMERHWSSLMVMLLRLRQGALSYAIAPQFVIHPTENHSVACDHPLLVSETYSQGGSEGPSGSSFNGISALLGEIHLDEVKCRLCQYVSNVLLYSF